MYVATKARSCMYVATGFVQVSLVGDATVEDLVTAADICTCMRVCMYENRLLARSQSGGTPQWKTS